MLIRFLYKIEFMHQKKALILVNVGTPDKPEVKYVRKYLSQFLNDRRVIDLPWLLQKMLVNLIIVPFRAPKSTILYQKLWTEKGSPLLIYLNSVTAKLQKRLHNEYDVYGAMSYGNPPLKEVLNTVKNKGYEEIVVFPLYPQYASSTAGSVSELVLKEIRNWYVIPAFRFVNQFYSHPAFVDAFVSRIRKYQPEKFDYVIFSYHGLPIRQINKVHPGKEYNQCTCEKQLPEHGTYCYKATCYETTRLLADKLQLATNSYTTSFQSRLSNNWLTPFTDKTLIDLASKGKKKLLVVTPSFVADCLETIIEIGDEYSKLFKEHGGENLVLVESLNDSDDWIEAIAEILKK